MMNKNHIKPWFSPGLLLLLLVCGGPAWAQGGGPALVKVAVASLQDIAPITLVPGTVVSRNDARMWALLSYKVILWHGSKTRHYVCSIWSCRRK